MGLGRSWTNRKPRVDSLIEETFWKKLEDLWVTIGIRRQEIRRTLKDTFVTSMIYQ